MLKKDLAGFFAFFLGVFGVHRFYLGQWWRGAAQFVGFWAAVAMVAETNGDMPLPFILVGFVLAPLITAIIFWATPYEKWAAKYDPEALVTQPIARTAPRQQQRPVSVADSTALKAEGVKYYRSGDYDLALEAFEEASERHPTDPVIHFNLACCYTLLGRYPAALQALELSVTFDLPKPERIVTHPALKELRESEAYRTFSQNNFRRFDLSALTAPTAAPPHSNDTEEVFEDLELLQQMSRLKELRTAGILTQLEYQLQREKLLG